MTRIFIIKSVTDKYVISSNNNNFEVLKTNLEFNGRDFFTKFLMDLELDEKIIFEVNKDESILDNSNEDRIFKELKSLIEKIANQINIDFNLLTEEIDEFLNDYDPNELPF